jgi:hypothetical protein
MARPGPQVGRRSVPRTGRQEYARTIVDIGQPKRIIEIEPATLPVPGDLPAAPERRAVPDEPAVEPEPAAPADQRSS